MPLMTKKMLAIFMMVVGLSASPAFGKKAHIRALTDGGDETCTAPDTFVNTGSEGDDVIIIGKSSSYGPYDGPFMGNFNGQKEEMFHTHRSGNAFEYIFDHKEYANGHKYYVTVGITEAFERFCHEGARLFNIFVNEQPFVKKLDVYKESGGCKHVLVMTKQMTPDDGIFEVSFEGLDNHRAMVAFIEIKAVEPNEC